MSNQQAKPTEKASSAKKFVVVKAITFNDGKLRKVIGPAKQGQKPVTVELDPNSSNAKRLLEREAIISVADYEKASKVEDDEPEKKDDK